MDEAANEPADEATAQGDTDESQQAANVDKMKAALQSDPQGAIEFKDGDVVINKDDVVQPDISRLEEKEKETPQVNNNVMAQIEERRRRLHGGG